MGVVPPVQVAVEVVVLAIVEVNVMVHALVVVAMVVLEAVLVVLFLQHIKRIYGFKKQKEDSDECGYYCHDKCKILCCI